MKVADHNGPTGHYNGGAMLDLDYGWEWQETGGGCTAYVLDLGDGRQAMITRWGDASAPATNREPVCLGLYDEDGEPLNEWRFDRATDAVTWVRHQF